MSDSNIQTMRDQGIADACAGKPARCWLSPTGDEVFVREDSGRLSLFASCDSEYRAAFVYARAYEANR